MFEAVSSGRKDAYLTQYQSLKMEPDENVMLYVNMISSLENKLAAIGYEIPMDEKRRVLLRGLRDEFSVIIGVVRATNKTFEEAVAQLVTQEA